MGLFCAMVLNCIIFNLNQIGCKSANRSQCWFPVIWPLYRTKIQTYQTGNCMKKFILGIEQPIPQDISDIREDHLHLMAQHFQSIYGQQNWVQQWAKIFANKWLNVLIINQTHFMIWLTLQCGQTFNLRWRLRVLLTFGCTKWTVYTTWHREINKIDETKSKVWLFASSYTPGTCVTENTKITHHYVTRISYQKYVILTWHQAERKASNFPDNDKHSMLSVIVQWMSGMWKNNRIPHCNASFPLWHV